jgi:Zn-dependent M28 family amino/carboxypeptidase
MARLEIAGAEEEKFTTYNVVGMVEGTDPKLKEEYVIYSAHYDHVGVGEANAEGDSIFNGTRDNAIGSMTVLEAAQNIAKNPTKRSSLFIFFTGEEKGLLGSEWYTSHPMLPLEKMVYCFNSDNAGYNNTEIITIVGLNRTSVANELITAGKAFGLEVNDDPVPDQNLYDRSDHVNFAREGIPALMFTLGITDFDDQVLKYYHQQADNPGSVDYDYLYKFTQAYVYACRLIGNKKETPVWTAGDKYEEAGKALYGR